MEVLRWDAVILRIVGLPSGDAAVPQLEKVAKDEKAKEWDVLNKYVGLKLRQHKLRREEMQINHQLALL